MLTARSYGGLSVTSAPSMAIRPSEGSSKPPTMRRSVVLPQPDGPSSPKNPPRRMSIETASTAATSPKRLVRPRISTLVSLPISRGGAYPGAGPPPLLEAHAHAQPQRPRRLPGQRFLVVVVRWEGAVVVGLV